jgi:hypothetical protein
VRWLLEFKTTEYGRTQRVVASEEVKKDIENIGINKCARESGFDRKNFIRKLVRDIPVKRNSYAEFQNGDRVVPKSGTTSPVSSNSWQAHARILDDVDT